MNKFFCSLFLTSMALLIASCKKDDTPAPNPEPDLPAYTHEGKNTIAFKLDGKPITMNAYNVIFSPAVSTRVQFDASTADQALSIRLNARYDGLNSPQTLDTPQSKWAQLRITPATTSGIYAEPYSNKTNFIKFQHFDNSVLAGTFELTLLYFNAGRPDIIDSVLNVTDGRFDIKVP